MTRNASEIKLVSWTKWSTQGVPSHALRRLGGQHTDKRLEPNDEVCVDRQKQSNCKFGCLICLAVWADRLIREGSGGFEQLTMH